ncbi:Peptidyl-prolyl cis-trans isomerase 1 [Glycine soja]|uniref:Peptidyl-prolyl cis-trans isomerase n=1 Tax=Glycine soja TaxID=3848 RepID=A0A445LIK5_GLYSO|nr:Peptidyl-prolyl cis-trans isomerase 1 [Glycine soja]
MPNPKVFFYMTIDGKPVGRIVMGLYTNVTPHTTKNFGAFCTGEKGVRRSSKPLHYKGLSFHDMISKTRGESIYGAKFTVKKHICLDILSMANIDPETIILKFFICMEKTEWLDGIGR